MKTVSQTHEMPSLAPNHLRRSGGKGPTESTKRRILGLQSIPGSAIQDAQDKLAEHLHIAEAARIHSSAGASLNGKNEDITLLCSKWNNVKAKDCGKY